METPVHNDSGWKFDQVWILSDIYKHGAACKFQDYVGVSIGTVS